jgi:hypothetical protein
MSREREHFTNFSIAGFTYYDGAIAFNQLKIGQQVKLVVEPTNQFDKNAVAIYLDDNKLGYLPRSCNREVSKVLNAGYSIFSAFIQAVNPEEHPENQVRVIVFINRSTV